PRIFHKFGALPLIESLRQLIIAPRLRRSLRHKKPLRQKRRAIQHIAVLFFLNIFLLRLQPAASLNRGGINESVGSAAAVSP
ncbi:MAG TPA: hypothetical protein DDX91_05385, partial [Ruminococcaceae bacterium]|nr:hypothetical protein [Oscillospiraceae bacterium]